MQAKASKIVILHYFLSIFYLINYYKNIQNIKNCLSRPALPGGGGVWYDTPVTIVETIQQMLLLYIIERFLCNTCRPARCHFTSGAIP